MTLIRTVILGVGIASTGTLLAGATIAQDYPARPIRMVVPFPPGAASDFLARVLGQKLGDTWGHQIVVDNRPGAGGLIGGTVVARANPDGYTIALPEVPTMSEAGMPGFVSETYFGLLGPAGIPKPIVTRINAESVRLLKTDEIRNRYQQNGAEPAPSTPEEFYKVQEAEYSRVKKIVQDIGLKPQF